MLAKVLPLLGCLTFLLGGTVTPDVKLSKIRDGAGPGRRIRSVMSLRIRVGLTALAALGAAVPTAQAANHRLVAFQSCPALLTYAKTHARPYVSAYGFGPGPVMFKSATPGAAVAGSAAADSARASAPTEGVDYSGTNVQETGVDEPDMVKTNGDTLFAAEGNQIEAVDV